MAATVVAYFCRGSVTENHGKVETNSFAVNIIYIQYWVHSNFFLAFILPLVLVVGLSLGCFFLKNYFAKIPINIIAYLIFVVAFAFLFGYIQSNFFL